MVVLFDKMVQKNKKTGFERRIRIALKDKGTNGKKDYGLVNFIETVQLLSSNI